MHITSRARAALTALTALSLAIIAVAGSTPARADIPTVSPGDRIEYLSPTADITMFCTVGYVYTGHDLHTYAVTAGHCRGKTAGYARATHRIDRRLHPRHRRAALPGRPRLRPDRFRYPITAAGLHRRHTHHQPSPATRKRPASLSHRSLQRPTLRSHHRIRRQNQYLTTGMPSSIPGDSGGPVWLTTATGSAEIIGIWLGEKTTTNGQEHGRFASLADGLQLLS